MPAPIHPSERRTQSIFRIGALSSLLVGLGFIAATIAAALMPAELQANPEISEHEFWTILANDPAAHLAMHWIFALSGLAGLGVVPAAAAWTWDRSAGAAGLLIWSSTVGMLGFAVLARSHLMEVAFDVKVLAAYVEADSAYQKAAHVVAGLALDVPDGLLTLGGIGLWIMTLSIIAYMSRKAGLLFLLIGISTTASLWIGVFGYMAMNQTAIFISFVGGTLVLGPLWHALLAAKLMKP